MSSLSPPSTHTHTHCNAFVHFNAARVCTRGHARSAGHTACKNVLLYRLYRERSAQCTIDGRIQYACTGRRRRYARAREGVCV